MGRVHKPSVLFTMTQVLFFLTPFSLSGCVVDAVCYGPSDCSDKSRCEEGRCVDISCSRTAQCRDGEVCNKTLGLCQEACPRGDTPLDCPEGTVSVEDAFCIDTYEASRPDATATHEGEDSARATSRPGVIPWQATNDRATSRPGVIPWQATNDEAQAACSAASKDLCTEREWGCACRGPGQTVYAYGDTYEPETCNGIDTFCFCDGACATHETCPFAGCYHECRAAFHLMPTGESSGCKSPYGAYDLNGNVWEHVKGGNPMRVRGGAYNCGDSETLHRCDYVPGDWAPSARGFRCCWRPLEAS
ncbi:MAG: SUMF1/EgtB/PvdO family nonheme iron enzyme [Deltaproteobacteria bacterium]|nr:SUMF1/EgtB/PvdO family nonheme iron enzyme [Deltaproteobacteria bacterium]